MKFGSLVENDMPITVIWSKLKPEEEYNMADACFSKPEIVISQPWIETFRRLIC